MRNKGKIISVIALFYLVSVGFFVWGLAAGHYHIFPWKQIEVIYWDLHAFLTFKDGPPKTVKEKILLDIQERPTQFNFSGFKLRDSTFHDTGYLLMPRYSKNDGQVIVQLFSIGDKKIVHTWVPPLDDIFKQSKVEQTGTNSVKEYRAQHPLLLKDGGLVFTSGEGPMVRINACSELIWVNDRHFHHSIELNADGNIVVPLVMTPQVPETVLPIRDDGFAIVSLDGKIINEYSVTDILLKNGYRGLIYGVGRFETDRIHLNDAQPILKDIHGAQTGDIALSIRHLSTVLLFDPQTGKIKWLKTGPWLSQHDINQLDDGRYSIFGNDIIRQQDTSQIFVEKELSNIYLFDADNGRIEQPYAGVMAEHKIATGSSGRLKLLANGDAYIEESDKSRILRISKDNVRWEYVNAVSPGTVGAVHWTRYISQDDIDLKWKDNLACDQQ
ncbi:arylsulfotransferase family protein [Desulfobacter sp.]|jgi:hypothetical protein|uniref:arylsulfotransferase family protein n=1 Tax=Desulfobacter sp. TaxID=2294 RepID=UPI000E9C7939|nr:arylsulfotransferase family protein [Desulfobacter sp.]HBT87095.1 aryl sulfotransferase [Desulfobacter sp.]